MNIQQLHLDKVKVLLAQAGQALPDPQRVGDVAFVQSLLDTLCELSARDAMTGLANRRYFRVELERELDRAARSGESALLLMVDIDHFKRVNDTYGHLAGDAVLCAVATALQDCIRPMDTAARLGGEEFAVVFPNCPPAFAAQVAERIRQYVQALKVSIPAGESIQVTVSCGGAFAPVWLRGAADDWMERADQELYHAKNGGRNQVCIEDYPRSDVSAEEKGLLFGWSQPEGLMIDASGPTN